MGHWYLPDGKPYYEVEKVNGGMRPAHLGDARKVNAVPSVTTIIGVLDKPALTNWKVEQSILAALTNPEIRPDMDVKDIMSIIKRDAMKQAKEAADIGTAIHDSIEAYFNGGWIKPEHQPTVDAVVALLNEKCGDQMWRAEQWFAHPMGFGGKVDLISDGPGQGWVIDFKTKPGNASDHKMYDEQLMQLVAYDEGMGGPARKLANIIVSRDIPGSVHWWEWDCVEEQEKSWIMFEAALTIWQQQKGYAPDIKAA